MNRNSISHILTISLGTTLFCAPVHAALSQATLSADQENKNPNLPRTIVEPSKKFRYYQPPTSAPAPKHFVAKTIQQGFFSSQENKNPNLFRPIDMESESPVDLPLSHEAPSSFQRNPYPNSFRPIEIPVRSIADDLRSRGFQIPINNNSLPLPLISEKVAPVITPLSVDFSRSKLTYEEIIRCLGSLSPQHRSMITHINLSQRRSVNENMLMFMGTHFPNLQSINLSNCPNLTDQALYYLGRGCPLLEKINVSNCPKVTCRFAAITVPSASFYLGFLSKLTSIDLSCCNIDDQSLRELLNECLSLNSIHLHNCPKITIDGIRLLIDNHVKIDYLNNDFGSQNAVAIFSFFDEHPEFYLPLPQPKKNFEERCQDFLSSSDNRIPEGLVRMIHLR